MCRVFILSGTLVSISDFALIITILIDVYQLVRLLTVSSTTIFSVLLASICIYLSLVNPEPFALVFILDRDEGKLNLGPETFIVDKTEEPEEDSHHEKHDKAHREGRLQGFVCILRYFLQASLKCSVVFFLSCGVRNVKFDALLVETRKLECLDTREAGKAGYARQLLVLREINSRLHRIFRWHSKGLPKLANVEPDCLHTQICFEYLDGVHPKVRLFQLSPLAIEHIFRKDGAHRRHFLQFF